MSLYKKPKPLPLGQAKRLPGKPPKPITPMQRALIKKGAIKKPGFGKGEARR